MRSEQVVEAHLAQIHPSGLDKIRRAVAYARASLDAEKYKHSGRILRLLGYAMEDFIDGWSMRWVDGGRRDVVIQRKISPRELIRLKEAFDVAVRYPAPTKEKSMAQVIHETRAAIAISTDRPDVWWRHHKDEL